MNSRRHRMKNRCVIYVLTNELSSFLWLLFRHSPINSVIDLYVEWNGWEWEQEGEKERDSKFIIKIVFRNYVFLGVQWKCRMRPYHINPVILSYSEKLNLPVSSLKKHLSTTFWKKLMQNETMIETRKKIEVLVRGQEKTSGLVMCRGLYLSWKKLSNFKNNVAQSQKRSLV